MELLSHDNQQYQGLNIMRNSLMH